MVVENWYRLLHPKVVHLVTTVNEKGEINCAPFAWLTPLCDDPPILLLSAWYTSHTFQNISNNKEFVVNVVPKELKEKMEVCAKSFPAGINELQKAGLTWSPSKTVKPPRVRGCMAWIECTAREIMKKENEYSITIADAKCVETGDGCYDRDFLPKKDVLLHLGGKNYSSMRR
jgi:flavin reductase (DIM6/NTAB) family NADH-FMN oxidoreductase RutF